MAYKRSNTRVVYGSYPWIVGAVPTTSIMLKNNHSLISAQLFYFITPILYNTSVEGNSSYYCYLLVDFVDSYMTLILAIFIIIALVLTKNPMFKLFSNTSTRAPQVTKYNLIQASYKNVQLNLSKYFTK